MRPTRAIHRGQLRTFRVGTKDQLAVMADKTKPFQAAPMDSLHNLLYWAAQHEGHNVSSEVCSHCKIAFNDAVECFIHCCLNSSGFSEYCEKWKFESHWSGAHFADLWANKKNCRKTLNWCPVAQCIYPYLLLLAKINLRPLQGTTHISLPPTSPRSTSSSPRYKTSPYSPASHYPLQAKHLPTPSKLRCKTVM